MRSILQLFLLALLGQPLILSGQLSSGVIYYKSGETQLGSIIGNDQSFYFVPEGGELKDSILIQPKQVDRFAILGTKSGDDRNQVFLSRSTTSGELLFVRPVKGTEDHLFTVGKKRYFLSSDDGDILEIPADKGERRQLVDNLLSEAPKLANNSLYSNREASYRKLSRFLQNPRDRYPGTYWGVELGYNVYTLNSITNNGAALPILLEDLTYDYTGVLLGLYLNKGIGNKGAFSYQVGIAGEWLESVDRLPGDAETLSYSTSATLLNFQTTVRHYLSRRGVFPFWGLGIKARTPIREKALLAEFQRQPFRFDLEVYDLGSNPQSGLSPLVEVGIEIPVKQQYFATLKASGSSVTDAQGDRTSIITLLLGINLL